MSHVDAVSRLEELCLDASLKLTPLKGENTRDC